MKRVTINVDLDDNEILSEEIRKAIDAEVKRITRNAFEQKFEDELSRLIEVRFNQYANPNSDSFGFVRNAFRERIDAFIREKVEGFSIEEADVRKRADEIIASVRGEANGLLKGIRSSYNTYLEREEQCVKDTIARVVDKTVREIAGQQVIRKLFGGAGSHEDNP